MAHLIIVGKEGCTLAEVVEELEEDETVYPKVLSKWADIAGQKGLVVGDDNIARWKFKRNLDMLTDTELLFSILTEWRSRNGSAATLDKLCLAFTKNKIKDVEERLTKRFVKLPRAANDSGDGAYKTNPFFGSNNEYPRHTTADKRFALIINIIKYIKSPPKFEDRNRDVGAPHDTPAIKDVLEGFGYIVDIAADHDEMYTKEYFLHVITTFRKKCVEKNIKSVVIFYGGHGEGENLEMSNGDSMNLYEAVVYQFNTENAPTLLDIPKIFIFQACQVFPLVRPEVPILDGNSSSVRPPVMDNALLCFATMPGYGANRFPEGSVYVKILCRELQNLAENTDLVTILEKVEAETWKEVEPSCKKMLEEGKSKAEVEEYKQHPTHRPFVHFKKYYFK